MPARLSASALKSGLSSKEALDQSAMPLKHRLLLLGLNLIPLLHLAAIAVLLLRSWTALPGRLAAAFALLYLAPPALARALRALCEIPQGRIAFGSRAFFGWWALLQTQMIFCRLPQLEEILRLVPGVYSLWLRLWGARVGRLTFWGPGVSILDRTFVAIGDDVVFGAAVKINPHVLAKNSSGETELILATVKIGDRATVGGYSLLAAGSEIAAGENPHALLVLPPFSLWKDGKRFRAAADAYVHPRAPR